MKKLLQSLVLSALVFCVPLVAVAPTASAAACPAGGNFFGLPTWYKYLECDANGDISVANTPGSIPLRIGLAIFEMLLVLAGAIAVFYVIFGGFKYVLSQGDPGKVSSAKSTVLNAIIGVIIALVSSQVVAFIGSKLLT